MTLAKSLAAAVFTAACLAGGVALAGDRAPTEAEAAAIKDSLAKAGFSAWGKVEYDDGKWEVDDAIGADGKRYDVDLSASDYTILKKELED
jgi:hypothetical protein